MTPVLRAQAGVPPATIDRNYCIDSVLRALDVIEYLANQGGGHRISDVAREIGCSKNTAFRLLRTLQERDFVRQADDSSYQLTFKLLTLGEGALRDTDLLTVSRPFLRELVDQFGDTASVAILDGREIVFLDRVLGRLPYHTPFNAGTRANAYSTSVGKAILAHSPDKVVDSIIDKGLEPVTKHTITDPERLRDDLRATVTRGYALDDQENILGICCVGMPVFDRKAAVVAAISVSGLAARMTQDRIELLAQSLVTKAAAISSRLGCPNSREQSDRGRL